MARRAHNGSAILLVLLVLSMMIIWCNTYWRMNSYAMEGILARQTYEQCFGLADAVLHYGVLFSKEHLEQLVTSPAGSPACTLRLGPWAVQHQHYDASLIVTPQNKQLKLTAEIFDTQRTKIMVASTMLETQQKDGLYHIAAIHDWQIHET